MVLKWNRDQCAHNLVRNAFHPVQRDHISRTRQIALLIARIPNKGQQFKRCHIALYAFARVALAPSRVLVCILNYMYSTFRCDDFFLLSLLSKFESAKLDRRKPFGASSIYTKPGRADRIQNDGLFFGVQHHPRLYRLNMPLYADHSPTRITNPHIQLHYRDSQNGGAPRTLLRKWAVEICLCPPEKSELNFKSRNRTCALMCAVHTYLMAQPTMRVEKKRVNCAHNVCLYA